MVSLLCKMLVQSKLDTLEIIYASIDLGEINLVENISDEKRNQLSDLLLASGLVLMDNHKSILVEKIKAVVIEMVHYADEFPTIKHSVYISQKLNYNYTYLANLFSEIKGITLERFIILHKIEKIKELILYDELNLSEIALRLHYSSSSHLLNQFKKITGLTPSFFKRIKRNRQNPLEYL